MYIQWIYYLCEGDLMIKLQYLKGSKEKNAWMLAMGAKDCRQWNVVSPVPGYEGTVPTFGLETLIEKNLLPGIEAEGK